MWVESEKFLYGLLSGYAVLCLDPDNFHFFEEYWTVSWVCLVVFPAVAAVDFVTDAFIFIVSLEAALCTGRYRFKASSRCVSIFKTSFAAHWSFKILKNLSFCLFPGISMNLGGSFFFRVSSIGIEEMFLVVIQVAFFTSRRLCSFFSSFPYSSKSGM